MFSNPHGGTTRRIAIGVLLQALKDTRTQLLNLEFSAVVKVEKGTYGFRDKSVVKRHLPLAEE